MRSTFHSHLQNAGLRDFASWLHLVLKRVHATYTLAVTSVDKSRKRLANATQNALQTVGAVTTAVWRCGRGSRLSPFQLPAPEEGHRLDLNID